VKTVLLMRHAKSDWSDADTNDHERPLNPRGSEDAPRMGRLLRKLGVVPDLIVSSPARRAWATAEHVAEACGYRGDLVHAAVLYAADGTAWIAAIRSLPADAKQVLIVAHSPGIEEAASILIGPAARRAGGAVRIRVPTAAILRVDAVVDRWADVGPGRGVLGWFLTPKLLKAID
jgi:phosphohistidine phosphatase